MAMLRALWTLHLGRCLTILNEDRSDNCRFATGWNYFFKYAIVLANNLTATGLIIQYWRPDLNVGIWVTVFAVLVISINVSACATDYSNSN